MKTEITELPESRVKVEVGVDAAEVKQRVDRAAGQMAGEMRIPGFRKGKVPPQMVIQRLGREAVLEQALRDSISEWYERAVLETALPTVGDPSLDVEDLPGEGEDLKFSFEVGVRPVATLGDYRGLEVGRADTEVPDESVSEELERLREGFGSLNPVERPAAEGDVAVIDYRGTIDGEVFDGSEGRDFAIEVGGEGLLAEFDEAVTGSSAGDEMEVEVTFPDDHQPEELAGKTALFALTIKEVREKELPDLDDDFAQQASEFDTIAELREEIRGRIREALEQRTLTEFREAAVDAAADRATVELPGELVHSRAHEMWERFERQLAQSGIDPNQYAQMQGKTREEIIHEGEEGAQRSLRREATLAAVAEVEQIEPSDDELAEALGPGEGDSSPEEIVRRLREAGRDALLREEVRMRMAADLIAEQAKPIPLEQAEENAKAEEARDALWTPEKGEPAEPQPDGEGEAPSEGEESGKLWTPGE
jgi:trigger factor